MSLFNGFVFIVQTELQSVIISSAFFNQTDAGGGWQPQTSPPKSEARKEGERKNEEKKPLENSAWLKPPDKNASYIPSWLEGRNDK